MSNKQTIITEINDLFRAPTALLYNGDAFKVVSWGADKSYLTWPDGAPEGWDELADNTEFFVGKSGDRYVTFAADNSMYTKLYSMSSDGIEEVADNICYELDIETDAYEMWE